MWDVGETLDGTGSIRSGLLLTVQGATTRSKRKKLRDKKNLDELANKAGSHRSMSRKRMKLFFRKGESMGYTMRKLRIYCTGDITNNL